jgi:hypothetical protein
MATVGKDGTPHVVPVGWSFNADEDAIEIGGFDLERTKRYRDVRATFDYVTGKHGLGLHRLNDDREIALASLDRLDAVDAEVVLPAHGEPWTGGSSRALEIARENY